MNQHRVIAWVLAVTAGLGIVLWTDPGAGAGTDESGEFWYVTVWASGASASVPTAWRVEGPFATVRQCRDAQKWDPVTTDRVGEVSQCFGKESANDKIQPR